MALQTLKIITIKKSYIIENMQNATLCLTASLSPKLVQGTSGCSWVVYDIISLSTSSEEKPEIS